VIVTGLVLLIGPPAAGKSTFARELVRLSRLDAAGVICADAIRSRLFGTAVRSEDDPAVFAEVDDLLMARASAGLPAVLDATNVTRAGRDRARRAYASASALRFPTVPALLLTRNRARPVPVREEVLLSLAATFRSEASLEQLRTEGFAVVADVPAPAALHWGRPIS
jgi:predicted kinase